MNECLDGEYQAFKSKDGAFVRDRDSKRGCAIHGRDASWPAPLREQVAVAFASAFVDVGPHLLTSGRRESSPFEGAVSPTGRPSASAARLAGTTVSR